MNVLKLTLAAAAASLAIAGAAQAQEAPTFSFNVGAATNYVYRGVSQTDKDPQVSGGVDATSGIFYAGAWASNVDFGNGTDLEYDLYAGITPTLGVVTLDLGVIYYGYVDSPSGSSQDFWEFKAAGSVPLGSATVGAAVNYSPDFFGGTGKAFYYEANAAFTIPETPFSISGAVGRQQVKGPGDYTTWNVGVGYAINDSFGIDLRYHDTNKHSFGNLYDSRLVASFSASF